MTKFDLSKLKARLDAIGEGFDGMEAKVGFPSNIQYEDGTPVAFIATIQNYGAPASKIPPRPFMSPAFNKNKDKWVKVLADGVQKVAKGSGTAFDALDHAGRIAAIDVQVAIADIDSPELSPITVLLRKWKKEGRTITGKTVGEAAQAIRDGIDPGSDNKPLNASGYMLASVRHNVSKSSDEELTE